jgi:hypothetical protein
MKYVAALWQLFQMVFLEPDQEQKYRWLVSFGTCRISMRKRIWVYLTAIPFALRNA